MNAQSVQGFAASQFSGFLSAAQAAALTEVGNYIGIIALTLSWLCGIALVITAIFKALQLADGRQRQESGWATISGLMVAGILMLNIQGLMNAISITFFQDCSTQFDFSRWMAFNGHTINSPSLNQSVTSLRSGCGVNFQSQYQPFVTAALHFFTAYGIAQGLRGIFMYRQIGSVTGKGAGSAVTHIVAGVFLANMQMWLATLLTALGMDNVRQTLFG